MGSLSRETCVACRVGAPAVSPEEATELLPEIPEWELVEQDGIKKLTRSFKFKTFSDALALTKRMGEIAEKEGHHPAILTEWARVGVTWWTHKIRGLHRNDFIMSAKTDQLYSGSR